MVPLTNPSYSGVYSNFRQYTGGFSLCYGADGNVSSETYEIDRQRRVTPSTEIAVTRMKRWSVAVRSPWTFSIQTSAELASPLRQKPTSIDRGYPVGTTALDRWPTASESLSSTPKGIEVAEEDTLEI